MSTLTWFLLLPAVLLLAALAFLLTRYLRLKGTRIVTCPETGRPAAVDLDVPHAAWSALVSSQDLRLADCTRWPERAGCGQACLAQVEGAPHDCLARKILARWYADRACAACGAAFGEIHWHDHRPALLDPGDHVVEWDAVAPETIPDVLQTHRALCWNCRIAGSFRAAHPRLVVDRDRDRRARRHG